MLATVMTSQGVEDCPTFEQWQQERRGDQLLNAYSDNFGTTSKKKTGVLNLVNV